MASREGLLKPGSPIGQTRMLPHLHVTLLSTGFLLISPSVQHQNDKHIINVQSDVQFSLKLKGFLFLKI